MRNVFLDWKNEHCRNDHTTQGNLQSQCNSGQITNGIFHRTRTKHFKIRMEAYTHILLLCVVKAILKKNNGPGAIRHPDFILYYKAKVIKTVWYWRKKKYRPMEQDRKLRDKHTHLRAPYI